MHTHINTLTLIHTSVTVKNERGGKDVLTCKLSFVEVRNGILKKISRSSDSMGFSQIAWFYSNGIAWDCSVIETESYGSNKHRERISICAFICTYARLHVYLYDYVCMYVHMYICIHIYAYKYIYKCIYVYIYSFIHIYTKIWSIVQKCFFSPPIYMLCVCVTVHIHIYMYTHTYIYYYTYIYMYVYL